MIYLVCQYGKHYGCKLLLVLQLEVPARTFKIGTPRTQGFDTGRVSQVIGRT